MTATNISIAAILVGIGIVSNSFIRLGSTQIITTSILVSMCFVLPFALSIISAIIIDVVSLIIKGQIGFWHWSFQLEPIIIIAIVYILNYAFTFIKTKKQYNILLISCVTLICLATIITMIAYPKIFSFYRGSKSCEEYVVSIVKNSLVIVSIIFIIYFSIKVFIDVKKKKKNMQVINYFCILLISCILIDWFYHPLATKIYFKDYFYIKFNATAYGITVSKGILMSMIHIGIGLPILRSLIFAYKQIESRVSNKNKY